DQDVQPAVAAGRDLHGVLPVRLAGDVQMHVRGFTPGRADGGLDLLALGVPDVAEDDPGAFPGKCLRFRRPLSPSPTTDQRDLPVEFSHGPRSYAGTSFTARSLRRRGRGCAASSRAGRPAANPPPPPRRW